MFDKKIKFTTLHPHLRYCGSFQVLVTCSSIRLFTESNPVADTALGLGCKVMNEVDMVSDLTEFTMQVGKLTINKETQKLNYYNCDNKRNNSKTTE